MWQFFDQCIFLFISVQYEMQLIKFGEDLVQPGDSLRLSCASSSLTFDNYGMSWAHQSPEKSLHWVLPINCNYSSIYYVDSVFTNDHPKNWGHHCILMFGRHSKGKSLWAQTQTILQRTEWLGCKGSLGHQRELWTPEGAEDTLSIGTTQRTVANRG